MTERQTEKEGEGGKPGRGQTSIWTLRQTLNPKFEIRNPKAVRTNKDPDLTGAKEPLRLPTEVTDAVDDLSSISFPDINSDISSLRLQGGVENGGGGGRLGVMGRRKRAWDRR